MPEVREKQRLFEESRWARDEAAAEARALALRAERLKARLASLTRTATGQDHGQDQIERLQREIAGLEEEAAARRRRRDDVDAQLTADLSTFVREPGDVFLALDDHLPFLLFPVRLETKFDHSGDRLRLRVRIFPDEVNVSTHDPLLSQGERDAGAAYWWERARALGLPASDRRAAELGAWTLLATRNGGPRARYIARQTKPAVWPPASPIVGPAPVPETVDDDEPVRLSHSVAPPRARLLPDYFVVYALGPDSQEVARAVGKPIPESLMLGPDPEAVEAELGRDTQGRLKADPKVDWLIDFNRAVEVGMAVTMDVPPEQERAGFRRVVAVGAKLSMDPDASSAALEELLAEHRFTGGIDLLRNGAPTNNSDGKPSAFTTDLSADEALVAQEVDDLKPLAVTEHADKSDAQRLAEALGVEFDAVSDWPSAAEAHDVADALAMNRALWPATIGRFMTDMMAEQLAPSLKREIEHFFLTYVTGRTLLPNVRIGRQPYAVLATGNLEAWEEDEPAGDDRNDMGAIVAGLNWFRDRFEEMGPVPQMGGGGDEALANSMRVIGQLASSASFASRKAVTDEAAWNTLNFAGVIPLIAVNWWNERVAERNRSFVGLPFDISNLPLADLVFFHDADPLAVPVVDQDPAIPLSETSGLSLFDGAHNYIDWLLSASTDDLRSEIFRDEARERTPPPKALLYRLLHNAWTTQLVWSSKDLFTRLHADLVTTVSSTSLINVGERKIVPDSDAPMFDAAGLGLVTQPRALGDHLLDVSRAVSSPDLDRAPEALPIQSQRSSLDRLAGLSTAALERLFAEHLDLGTYRLDAWQSGLVSRRLDGMRRRRQGRRGLYLGAYGYVENLVPKSPPRNVEAGELPEKLRDAAPVTEQKDNGGFVHAPSLTHAVSAAVLRNAYLTHAEPATRDLMSVNLTSRRVRAAMALVEGIRAGQDLSALLGYQFERGLHERYPGIELDSYIYVLRARFPLVSRRLTPVPDGTPAELVEARNVIDGKDFLDHVRANPGYPYGIADLADPGSDEAGAIASEIEQLEESLDSVADLMLAEGVHQAVQSNIDRARGVVSSMGEGEIPPEPDVIQTPRSGRVFTQRVALHLPAAGPGWNVASTPRAVANPRLNAWLLKQLPAPDRVGFEARPAGGPAQTTTLDAVGLEPIDLVLLCGDRFGDGTGELERYLADHWRSAHSVADEVVTYFSGPTPAAGEPKLIIDLSAASGATPLGRLLPHLRALRRLIGGARGLNAQDYRLGEDSDKADAVNPKSFRVAGDELADLPGRCATARGDLEDAADALEGQLDAVAASYDAIRSDPASFDPAAWTGPLATLRSSLRLLVLFGTPEALPRSAAGTSSGAALSLYEQGRVALVAVRKRLEAAGQALAPLPVEPPREDPREEERRLAARLDTRLDNLQAAGRLLLGGSFVLQPVFTIDGAPRAEIEARIADPVEKDPLVIETWLQSLARVRPRIGDVALASAAAMWNKGEEPRLVPVQLPLRTGDPWIAQAWSTAPADGEILSVTAIDAPTSLAGDLEGLLIDDWTESVPGLNETTGIAFHFDRPSAAAPQALLLVTPSRADGRWQQGELLGAVVDTFERARLRAIEPDLVVASSLFPIVPMSLSPFSHGSRLASTFLARDTVRFSAAPE